MKVLVSCQHYRPEPFNTADVCEGLVERGHEVTCITALPNTGMPGNDIPNEWRNPVLRDRVENGVRVIRVPLSPRKSGAKARVMNYLSFWRNANKAARMLPGGIDVTLGYQFSPVMQADPALAYSKKYGAPSLLYCFDLWPVSLTAGGFSESSLPYRWMGSVSKRIYSEANRIAVTSPLFDEYFRNELNLTIDDSLYLPQYADDVFSASVAGQMLPEGYNPEKINITFAGNVGQAQSVITVVEAAALLRDRDDIVFHVVGSGSRLSECEGRARELGLRGIVFHGRHDVSEMPAYYAASDAMLVTFEASPMAEYTLPRKATTYLAAGRPILAALGGETKRVIDAASCGFSCNTADAAGLARIAVDFSAMPKDKREHLGTSGRAYYESHFTKDRFFSTLESELEKLKGTKHGM